MARFSFALITVAAALFFGATTQATPVTGLATRAVEGAELSETQCTDSAIVGSLLTTSLSLLDKSAKSADAAANAELETLKAFLTAANLIENQVLAGCNGNNTNTNNTEGEGENKDSGEAAAAEPAKSAAATSNEATKTTQTQTKAKADAAVKNAKPSVAAIIASAKAAMETSTQRPSRFNGRPGPRPRRL